MSSTKVSDFFGIGNAIRGAAGIYFRSARRSGRTNALLESLKDGDRVVFMNRQEADRVQKLALKMGKQIKIAVISPENIEEILRRGSSQGRTIFDHSWVEQFYLREIDRSIEKLNYFQVNASGRGAPHLETQLAAENIVRWEPR